MTKLTCSFTHPGVSHSEERSDEESLRIQRKQGLIAVFLWSDSVHSGEIPLPTAVGIGMTCWGIRNTDSVKACSGFVVYCSKKEIFLPTAVGIAPLKMTTL